MSDDCSEQWEEHAEPSEVFDGMLLPGCRVERSIFHCAACARDHGDHDHREIEETYSTGFSRAKFERCHVSWDLILMAAVFGIGTLVMTILCVLIGYAVLVQPARFLSLPGEAWASFGAALVVTGLAVWVVHRTWSRILRAHRLVAYHERSPEPGVTVTDRVFAPSWAGRFRSAIRRWGA